MRADVLIIGQGLAGSLLAWELERAGISYAIADSGHAQAASRVGAGIINPVTGRRIVKCWKVDTFLPVARETYCALEAELRVPLWRELRVRRFYLDENERRVLAEKQAKGDLAEYAGTTDGEGFWIEGAARVDTAALISAMRTRLRAAGVLREERVDLATARREHQLTIDCTGAAMRPAMATGDGLFRFVPWQYSKGESLTIAIEGLMPNVVLNRGHWLLPLAPGLARVGATHAPSRRDTVLTPEARAALEASARAMSTHDFVVMNHEAGVRVYLADKKPVAGRHPADPRVGVLNGLGAKGALFAPLLARQWASHLQSGAAFEREIDVARLWRG